jgi:hypothetical protein
VIISVKLHETRPPRTISQLTPIAVARERSPNCDRRIR